MNAKKWLIFLFAVCLLISALCLPAAAAGVPEFRYELSVDGSDTVEVSPGDIITVTLHLYRTDADAVYSMYAMQDEIRYDSEFFELVEDSALLSSGIQSTDIAMVDHYREFYMNYVSFSGGAQWNPKTRIGSFQLKVTGTSGVTTITNEDFLVSLPDGSGSYKCQANELTVILTTECTVKFETNGGTPVDPVTTIYGEKLTRPEDPAREGKRLEGWYSDIHLTQPWDFENDTVKGNMTLYAKWADGEPTPTTSPDVDPKPSDGSPRGAIIGILAGLIVLFLLFLLLLPLLLWKSNFVRYSLKTGDISMNHRDKEHDVQVEVVLLDGGREYHLHKGGVVTIKNRLWFIKNVTNATIADVKPGNYNGKLIVAAQDYEKVEMCKIKVLDRELKTQFKI